MAAAASCHSAFLHCRKHQLAGTAAIRIILTHRPAAGCRFSRADFVAVSCNASSGAATPVAAPSAVKETPSLHLLESHLRSGDYRQADEVTRRLLIELAGEQAKKRGYVFFSEVQFIDAGDLRAVDALWREHSGGRFGYSVQRRLWEKARRDFTAFFIRVGWMKKLDTEVEQYNYRAFPDEFIWELAGDTPEGHLPLTNALRGTQLLASIFAHPAFDDGDDTGEQETPANEDGGGKNSTKVASDFKPDYSF